MKGVPMGRVGFVFAVCLGCLLPGRYGECAERVAVLEFRDSDGSLARGERDYLVDSVVRGAVREALPADRYLVMTKETMIELLQEQRIDFEKVCEGSCELEVGRKIGAHYIVTGSCWRIGGTYRGRDQALRHEERELAFAEDGFGCGRGCAGCVPVGCDAGDLEESGVAGPWGIGSCVHEAVGLRGVGSQARRAWPKLRRRSGRRQVQGDLRGFTSRRILPGPRWFWVRCGRARRIRRFRRWT